ncbi:hypothetical protein RHGRI_019810 [Rhododendron griersonianum]|uniref:Uncharacterized protein n=1 Tax=Rhododendron griersonianum TaxID=479676 RepID=A0AAV6JDY2_9ERIC|nr:hypothetical protein RHGRI_019810 [Rhododendron griersonianum]
MEATLAIVGLEICSSLLDLLYGIDPNELAFVLLGSLAAGAAVLSPFWLPLVVAAVVSAPIVWPAYVGIISIVWFVEVRQFSSPVWLSILVGNGTGFVSRALIMESKNEF